MGAEVHQLPRGRHRLTREEVLASQRGRMLAAIAEATAERGFARVTVADVLKRAGVSRETFYEQFTDKEDCFVQALDAGVDGLIGLFVDALALPAATPVERLRRVLDVYLRALADEPVFSKAYLIDAYGAGDRAARRRIELQQRFVLVVAGIFEVSAEPGSMDLFACEALVAAVSSLVTARVGEGRADELPELLEPLMALVDRMFPRLAAHPVQQRKRGTR